MAHKKKRGSAMRRLHRGFGIGAAAFVLFMVLSGLAINHARDLELDQRHVELPLILKWYGLGEPENMRSYEAGGRWLSFAGSQLYLDGRPVSTLANGAGAIFNENILIAAGSSELILLDRDGVLIERMPWDQVEKNPVEAIGLLPDGSVALKSRNQLWRADTQLLDWQMIEQATANPQWATSKQAPEEIRLAVMRQYRGAGVSLERLLLDFHSGRIFGTAGLLVYDLLALAVGFLAISGLVLWARGRQRKPLTPRSTEPP